MDGPPNYIMKACNNLHSLENMTSECVKMLNKMASFQGYSVESDLVICLVYFISSKLKYCTTKHLSSILHN